MYFLLAMVIFWILKIPQKYYFFSKIRISEFFSAAIHVTDAWSRWAELSADEPGAQPPLPRSCRSGEWHGSRTPVDFIPTPPIPWDVATLLYSVQQVSLAITTFMCFVQPVAPFLWDTRNFLREFSVSHFWRPVWVKFFFNYYYFFFSDT